METTPIETSRMILRPFTPGDVEAVHRYRSDPEVMKYILGGIDDSMASNKRVIERYREHQATYGFSKWAVVSKESQRIIGDSGLMFWREGPDFELGYKLARPYWGQGLASEIARAWLDAAHTRFSLARVIAFAHPENLSSLRILQKVGMTYDHTENVRGVEMPFYLRVF